jgi:hypothetical protein
LQLDCGANFSLNDVAPRAQLYTAFCSETQIGNRLLRSRLGRRRVLLSDADRRTLATLAKAIGTEALRALDPLVSPATLLRWHRQLVAQKWTFLEARRPGRPRTKIDVEQLVVRMARENPGWGYTRIHGLVRIARSFQFCSHPVMLLDRSSMSWSAAACSGHRVESIPLPVRRVPVWGRVSGCEHEAACRDRGSASAAEVEKRRQLSYLTRFERKPTHPCPRGSPGSLLAGSESARDSCAR